MQTFLPFPSFAASAAVFDDRRLGKQRVECLQILRAGHLEDYGWARHPAVLMWRGHRLALVAYGMAMVEEWVGRGRPDSTLPQILEFALPGVACRQDELPADAVPPWLGWEALHASHRATLMAKDPAHYGPRLGALPDDMPLIWPEPTGESQPLGPVTAWAFRPDSALELQRWRRRRYVALPPAFATPVARPKQRRQAARLCDDVRPGDLVVVTDAAILPVGVVAGEAGGRALRRPVRWIGAVPRGALRRPWQLQDPCALFAIRDEAAAFAGMRGRRGGEPGRRGVRRR